MTFSAVLAGLVLNAVEVCLGYDVVLPWRENSLARLPLWLTFQRLLSLAQSPGLA